jgi:hypothetical protein
MDKGVPTIVRSCETDVGSSAIKNAADLEARNDRIAKGKCIRLDFRLVLADLVVERVAADLNERFTCRVGKAPVYECEYEGNDQNQENESDRDAESPARVKNNWHNWLLLFM